MPTRHNLGVSAMARLAIQPKGFTLGFVAGAIFIYFTSTMTGRYERIRKPQTREKYTDLHPEVRPAGPLLFSDVSSHKGNGCIMVTGF